MGRMADRDGVISDGGRISCGRGGGGGAAAPRYIRRRDARRRHCTRVSHYRHGVFRRRSTGRPHAHGRPRLPHQGTGYMCIVKGIRTLSNSEELSGINRT